MSYLVNEPHPQVPKSNYLPAGRGGAGNYARYNTADITNGTEATGPASRAVLSKPASSQAPTYTTGRGGAGNAFKPTKDTSRAAFFSFDEELAREDRARDMAAATPVYHIGRGGAGNLIDEMKPRARASVRACSVSSGSSAGSEGGGGGRKQSIAGALNRISRTFSRTN